MKTKALIQGLTVLSSLTLFSTLALPGQEQGRPEANSGQAKVYVFVQRTEAHVKRSNSEVFEKAMKDVFDYLKARHVAIAVDEFGGRNHAESPTPMATVFNIARDAKASSVLYVVVDRPAMKWLKMTARCYDMNEKQLWQVEASSGGGLSGAHGLEVTTKKLHEELDKRIGKEGLPILGASEPAAQKQ